MKMPAWLWSTVVILFLIFPGVSQGSSIGGPHLWLSTDPASFNEGGAGYVDSDSDPWLNDSYVTGANPFDLYIYNADHDGTAYDLKLLIAVHAGETGTVSVAGTDYTSFLETDLAATGYGGGSHGIYQNPAGGGGDAVFAIAYLGIDLGPQTSASVNIAWQGFSAVHFDVVSTAHSKPYWNPPSHDATATPLPGAVWLIGSGLVGLAGLHRRRHKA